MPTDYIAPIPLTISLIIESRQELLFSPCLHSESTHARAHMALFETNFEISLSRVVKKLSILRGSCEHRGNAHLFLMYHPISQHRCFSWAGGAN